MISSNWLEHQFTKLRVSGSIPESYAFGAYKKVLRKTKRKAHKLKAER